MRSRLCLLGDGSNGLHHRVCSPSTANQGGKLFDIFFFIGDAASAYFHPLVISYLFQFILDPSVFLGLFWPLVLLSLLGVPLCFSVTPLRREAIRFKKKKKKEYSTMLPWQLH